MELIVEVDSVGTYRDGKYFRVFVKIDTHTFHTEQVNEETRNKLLGQLLDVKIGDVPE